MPPASGYASGNRPPLPVQGPHSMVARDPFDFEAMSTPDGSIPPGDASMMDQDDMDADYSFHDDDGKKRKKPKPKAPKRTKSTKEPKTQKVPGLI